MCENHKRTYGIELEGYTDENIRGNHVEGWRLINDGSLSDGDSECDSCEGSGRYEERCNHCDGDGYVDCSTCEGSEEVPCDECEGTGEKECSSCDGEGGQYDDEENWIECNQCDGSKKINCSECNGYGYSSCPDCNNGREGCSNCEGEGYFYGECENCGGSGNYDDSNEGYGVECVSDICEEGDYEPINQIFDYISRYDWQTHSDCGTHVHIGGKDLEATDLSKLAILCNIVEPMIYGTLNSDRFHGTYAKMMKRDMVEDFIAIGDGIELQQVANQYYGYRVSLSGHFQKYDGARYYGLNLHSWFLRKTIEFRYFEGCENEEQAKGWIDLCIKLVDFAKHTSFEQLKVIGKEFHSVTNLDELIAKVKVLLGLEYNFRPTSNYAYSESKRNIASQLRTTHTISRAV